MQNPFNSSKVYVLRLADGCWYVGYTAYLAKRIKKHVHKPKVQWIQQHPVLAVERVFDDGSLALEATITYDLLKLYGIGKVRGANYTTFYYPDSFGSQHILNHTPVYIRDFL